MIKLLHISRKSEKEVEGTGIEIERIGVDIGGSAAIDPIYRQPLTLNV